MQFHGMADDAQNPSSCPDFSLHPVRADFSSGKLDGPAVESRSRHLCDLADAFADNAACKRMAPDTPVYEVQFWHPVPDGTEGGLFIGVTRIFPGKVGAEYFMTRGHFHEKRERGEIYSTHSGRGVLLLMDEDRRIRYERMTAGSVHYIPGRTAHRVINIGSTFLSFWAQWPSDAGHDYRSICEEGFAARILDVEGSPTIITATCSKAIWLDRDSAHE